MADGDRRPELDAARREGTEQGRRIGLSQATGELLQLLDAERLERDALWELVERLTSMSSTPARAPAEPASEPATADEASFEDEATAIDGRHRLHDVKPDAEGQTLRLTAREDEGDGEGLGARWFLGLKPVEPRARLELLLIGGRWLQGTFEWSGRSGDRPTFHVVLGGDWEPSGVDLSELASLPTVTIPRVSFPLPPFARFRWPRS